ncbi:MAG: c-type cytochrome [Bacteriovoracaceae bacterium]
MKNISFKVFSAIGLLLVLGVFGDPFYRGLRQNYFEPKLSRGAQGSKKAKAAIKKYGCHACHVIPGVSGANGRVGPKLEDIKEQIYIGGVLANTPEHMAEWVMNPQRHSPNTAMPNLNVSEEDAKAIVDYLYNVEGYD